ncbi:DUF4179 domain-containing protein [Paenibacillus wulumuqiensis]|uniref:DUF4179 domain-containing protein n=1 Tax=Paenibacillus wulumuqiensis TaxID=1567107 RepID=UPI000619D849|nr:DUF4179 domain-containing protein [Paenibacillus wulumuqiensis]
MGIHFDSDSSLKELQTSILNTSIEVDLQDKIMKNLDDTQEKLPFTVKKTWKFKALTAFGSFAAVVTLLLGSSMASPAIASTIHGLPVVGSLFQMAGDMGLKIAYQQKLYTEINTNDTYNELTIKASAVSYDGTRVAIAIEGSKTEAYKDWNDKIQDIDITINGKSINHYSTDHHTTGIFSFPGPDQNSMILEFGDLRNQGGAPFPDQFNAGLDLHVEGIQRPLRLDVPVQLNTDNIQTTSPSIQKSTKNIGFKVNTLAITPITTTLVTEFILPTKMNNTQQKYGYELWDDNGHKIKLLYAYGWNDGNSSTTDTKFEPFQSIPRAVTIKPFKYLYQKNSNKYKTDIHGNIQVKYIPELEITLAVNQHQ